MHQIGTVDVLRPAAVQLRGPRVRRRQRCCRRRSGHRSDPDRPPQWIAAIDDWFYMGQLKEREAYLAQAIDVFDLEASASAVSSGDLTTDGTGSAIRPAGPRRLIFTRLASVSPARAVAPASCQGALHKAQDQPEASTRQDHADHADLEAEQRDRGRDADGQRHGVEAARARAGRSSPVARRRATRRTRRGSRSRRRPRP